MKAVLAITNGITRVSLLRAGDGFSLNSWKPDDMGMKITRRQSYAADGSIPVDYQWENITDTFELAAAKSKSIALDNSEAELRLLLLQAIQYWKAPWNSTPVWIERREQRGTGMLYAYVFSGSVSSQGNPFAVPRAGCPSSETVSATIEHGPWQSVQPGTATATAAAGYDVAGGFPPYGNAYSDGSGVHVLPTTDYIFVANKHSLDNLQSAFWYDASTGLYSAIVDHCSLTGAMWPNPPGVGDCLYFCFGTTTSPADSLVITVAVAQSGITHVWEYWDGGAWVVLPDLHDDTLGFTVVGQRGIHWLAPIDWAPRTINAIVGLKVRARITATPGPVVRPQFSGCIYSATWNFAEIAEGTVLGDMEALLRLRGYLSSNTVDGLVPGGDSSEEISRVVVGLRSFSRPAPADYYGLLDDKFQACLNAANVCNPTGVTYSVVAATDTSIAADMTAPSGYETQFTPAASSLFLHRSTWEFDSTAIKSYFGRYAAFLRCRQTSGNPGDCQIQLRMLTGAGPSGYSSESNIVSPQVVGNDWQILELGTMTVLPDIAAGSPFGLSGYMELWASAADALGLEVADLILIPADEWIGDFGEQGIGAFEQIDIDSAAFQKLDVVRSLATTGNPALGTSPGFAVYPAICSSPAVLQRGARQRLWFLFMLGNGTVWYSFPGMCIRLKIETARRYRGARGTY